MPQKFSDGACSMVVKMEQVTEFFRHSANHHTDFEARKGAPRIFKEVVPRFEIVEEVEN